MGEEEIEAQRRDYGRDCSARSSAHDRGGEHGQDEHERGVGGEQLAAERHQKSRHGERSENRGAPDEDRAMALRSCSSTRRHGSI